MSIKQEIMKIFFNKRPEPSSIPWLNAHDIRSMLLRWHMVQMLNHSIHMGPILHITRKKGISTYESVNKSVVMFAQVYAKPAWP